MAILRTKYLIFSLLIILYHSETFSVSSKYLFTAIRTMTKPSQVLEDHFTNLDYSQKIYEALARAVFIKSKQERDKYLDGLYQVRKKPNDEVQKYMDENSPIQPPLGFTVVNPYIGSGKYSWVQLVRSDIDGQLFAWKLYNGTPARTGDSFKKHLNLHRIWIHLGFTTATMYRIKGTGNILHKYIEGKTLKETVLDGEDILVNPEDPRNISLRNLLETLVRNHAVLYDLNARNIVFDGEIWQVIDSQKFVLQESGEKTAKKLRSYLTYKWTKRTNGLPQSSVDRFFDIFEEVNVPRALSESSGPSDTVREMIAEEEALKYSKEVSESVLTIDCAEALSK